MIIHDDDVFKILFLGSIICGLLAGLFLAVAVIFAVVPKSCTLKQFDFGVPTKKPFPWYTVLLNRGGATDYYTPGADWVEKFGKKQKEHYDERDFYIDGMSLKTPDRFMLVPDVNEDHKVDGLDVDASRSYSVDDLKKAGSNSQNDICNSPFGCAREYTTVKVKSAQFSGGNLVVVAQGDTGAANQTFNMSAFASDAKVTAANPFFRRQSYSRESFWIRVH